MNESSLPKQSHIDFLLENPRTAIQFDEMYGEGASTKYLPEVETTPAEKEQKDQVEGITANALVGIKEGIRGTLETLEGLSDLAEENIPLGGIAFGSDASNGIIEYLNPEEYKKKIGGDLQKDEGIFQAAADVLPESGEASGVAGGITREVSKFVTGFVGGGTVLKSLGWARGASTGLNVTRSFVQGGIADFAVFDEHEERLADFIANRFPEIDNDFLEYMQADENDTFAEGKFKNVLEGVMLGGVAELLFKTVRMSKGVRNLLSKGDKKGAKKFAEAEAKDIEDIKQKAADEGEGIDTVSEEAKGTRGLPDPDKPKKKFNIKQIKDKDFFKNVQETIKKIRTGDADIDDLEELTTSLDFAKDIDDVALIVRAVSDEINKVTKEFDDTLNHDQVWRQVDNMFDTPEEALIKAQELAKVTDKAPAIILAQRVVLNGLLKNYQKTSVMFDAGKATQKELDDALDILQSVYRLDRQLGKNTGRALEIRKVVASGQSKAAKKVSQILEEAEIRPEEGATRKGKDAIHKKMKKAKNKKGVMAILKAAQEKLGINFINKFWINSLLSNPKTHMINMTSNTLMAIIRPMEMYMGGVLTRDKEARIQAIQTAAGLIKYFTDSLIMARESFRKSDSILDTKNFKVDLGQGAFKKGASTAEKIIEAPTRFLSAEDEFFKQLNYRAAVYGQAVAEGIRKGLSKKKLLRTADGRKYSELDKYVEDRFDEAFLPDGQANPKFKLALEYAQENTFTKGLGQNTLGKSVQSAVNTVPVLRQIMPFVRTPVTIARAVWDRSPIGIFRKAFREELFSPNKTIRAQAIGKQTLGTAMFTTAIILAYNGVITGGVPKDKNLRRQKFDTGWRPYSFKLGNKYYSYERLDPMGMFFGLIADYQQIAHEITEDERNELGEANQLALLAHMDFDDYSEMAGGALVATTKNIASKTYLKSLTDFLSALGSGDPREWKRYGLTKTGSFVPNIVKGIANDPIYREVRTLTDTLKTRTGFYGNVDPSFNAIGEIRSKDQTFMDSFFNPFSSTGEVDDVILKEFDRLGQGFSPISDKLGTNKNIDLLKFTKGDKNAWVRFNELLAENGELRKDLEELITSDKYQRLTDNPVSEDMTYRGSKQAEIKRIINKYKKRAKKKLLKEGFLTENNLDLNTAISNDKRNSLRIKRKMELLPLE